MPVSSNSPPHCASASGSAFGDDSAASNSMRASLAPPSASRKAPPNRASGSGRAISNELVMASLPAPAEGRAVILSAEAAAAHDEGADMIRTGEQYRAGLRDGREIWIDGERVADVTTHPAFKPIVDAKARMYDLAHDPAAAPTMTFEDAGERFFHSVAPADR